MRHLPKILRRPGQIAGLIGEHSAVEQERILLRQPKPAGPFVILAIEAFFRHGVVPGRDQVAIALLIAGKGQTGKTAQQEQSVSNVFH